ncbi:MAG: hypothetical protein WC635_05925 [Bacteriovorax sp.]
MTNQTKHILFYTGAPGSRWSAISQTLGLMPHVNKSDESPERVFNHTKFSGHRGMYFGPGMELGKSFDRIADLSRAEILEEIDRAYEDKNSEELRVVKAHVFSYQLETLKEKFPESRFMLVWRSDVECIKWWFEIGGFNIQYPKYDWYIDEATIKQRISEENKCIKDFAQKYNLALEPFNAEWIKKNFGHEVLIKDQNYFKDIYVAITE